MNAMLEPMMVAASIQDSEPGTHGASALPVSRITSSQGGLTNVWDADYRVRVQYQYATYGKAKLPFIRLDFTGIENLVPVVAKNSLLWPLN
jgi:hypothetical protein